MVSIGVQWDKDCEVIFATINEFIQWTTLEDVEDENKFKRFDANKMWAYADYMYLKPLLENMNINLKEIIDWSKLGFNKEEGVDSSIWIGSKGAYTVCHQDSYGYNLVYQVCCFISDPNILFCLVIIRKSIKSEVII